MEDVMTMRSIELKTYIYAFTAIETCMCDQENARNDTGLIQG